MRRAVLWMISALVLITAWCIPAWGRGSPEVVMKVALSVALPIEFLLEQDAYVFPLLPAELVEDEKDTGRERDVTGKQSYIGLFPSKEPFRIQAGNIQGEIVLRHPSGEEVSFLGGLRIVPTDYRAPAFQIGNRRYPGGLEISCGVSRAGANEIVVVNLVDLETYTEGVLAGEVYPTWAAEALKAQAVATRTYALRRKSENKSRSYDVDDTVLSQVYVGENRVEAFKTAVFETRGQVVVYDGVPIKAHYFSSGGGTTEGDEEVWLGGSDEPYLTAREDFDVMSPHYRWKEPVIIKGSELLEKLGLQSSNPGWIEPSIRSGDKILAYRFGAGDKVINLTREQIRRKLGLESPRFHITVIRDKETGKEVETREELSSKEVVVFDGVGKGHGVGLSQWGAQGMASILDSNGVPFYTYVDILSHYYPGAELVDNYNIPAGVIEVASGDHAEPAGETGAEPADKGSAVPVYEISIQPKIKISMHPEFEISIQPKNEGSIQPEAKISKEPEVEISEGPEAEPGVQPEGEDSTQPEAKGNTQAKDEGSTQHEAEAGTQPEDEISAQPDETGTEPECDSVREPVKEHYTERVQEHHIEPM